jgi:hypothetical protein
MTVIHQEVTMENRKFSRLRRWAREGIIFLLRWP